MTPTELAALAEQGKALAAARVAEREAMLVVEQQDREIERLREENNLERARRRVDERSNATLRRQLAEAREVLQDIKDHGGGDDSYLYCWDRARQWLASTEKQ